MKKILSIVAVSVVVITLVASSAFCMGCCPGKGDYGRRGEGIQKRIMEKLGLTQDQSDKLSQNRRTQHNEMEALRFSIKEKKIRLKQALEKPGATAASVAPLASELKDLQAKMVDLRISGVLKVKEILTPEQFQKLEEMKDRADKKRMKKMKHYRKDW